MALARHCAAAPLVLAIALAAPCAAGASTASHFDCRVTGTAALERLGREGQTVELSQFTCRITGGILDGFVAAGTNIWEPGADSAATLLGSIVVAHKAGSVVVYEVEQATRKGAGPDGKARAGSGHGHYKLATGTAAALAGHAFRTVARREGPDRFSIDAIVED
jgi:hypothetical protein